MHTYAVTEKGEATKKGFFGAYFGTLAFVVVLYASLTVYGIAVMRGMLEEKSSRAMEVLLGALSPDELMTGKILGIGLVGLTQMAVYVVAAGTLRLYIAAQGGEGELGAVLEAFTPLKLAYFILFLLLGYFMYTAIFAAIGAVCNTEQEAQNLQSPVILCLVIPMLATFFLLKNPDSTAATVVSLIPLFAPMVMFLRISVVTPPFWEILPNMM